MSEAIQTPAEPAVPAEPAAPPKASSVLTPPAPDATAPDRPWANGMDADQIAYFENKGWHKADNPQLAMMNSYQNIERLRGVGAENLVKIPNADNAEEMAEFRQRMGVPESAEAYESPEVLIGDQPLNGAELATISHALGHTPQQHAEFVQAAGALISASKEAQDAAYNAQLSADVSAREADLGPQLEANNQAVRAACEKFEVDGEKLDALEAAWGHRATMDFMANLGASLGEHKPGFEGAEERGAQVIMGKDQAAAEIKVKTNDEAFRARLKAGDAAAVSEWANLQEIAFRK